jgi:hypothetical protein
MGAYVRGEHLHAAQGGAALFKYFPWLERRRDRQAGTLSGGSADARTRPRVGRPGAAAVMPTSRRSGSTDGRQEISAIVKGSATTATVLVVEAECERRARCAARATARGDQVAIEARRGASAAEGVESLPRLLMSLPLAVVWSEVAQQVTSGLAAGAVYASLALALVLIYQTTNVVNFARGDGDLRRTSPGRS